MNASDSKILSPAAPALLGLLFFLLYAATAAPSLGWRDSPEFTVTAHTLGVSHPAGFPTYNLLAKLLTFLPLAGLAFRVTLFSALSGAMALVLVYHLVFWAGQGTGEKSAAWAAAGTVLLFGLGPTFWGNAGETEVYTLNVFFLALILLCAVRWSASRNEAWLYAGALFSGLGLGNHGAMVFALPGLLIYFFGHSRTDTWRRLFLMAFFFLLGLSVYLYLPLRSAADPTFDWGNSETWSAFIGHVTDRKDAETHFREVRQAALFWEPAYIFVSRTVPRLFWPLGLPLCILGGAVLFTANRPLLFGLLWILTANVVFFLKWTNPTAFLPAWLCASVLWGVGLARGLAWLRLFRRAAGRALLAALAGAVFLGGVWFQLPVQDRSGAFLAAEAFQDDYEALAMDGVSLTAVLWFHQRAYRDVYRMREDVTVMGLSDFMKPRLFNRVTADRFPGVVLPPGGYEEANGVRYLQRFVAANLDAGRAIYFEPINLIEIFYPNLVPDRELLFRFTPRPVDPLERTVVQAAFDRLRAKFNREIEDEGLLEDPRIDAYYIRFLTQFAVYLRLHGRPADSLAMLNFIRDMFGPGLKNTVTPDDLDNLDNLMGASLLDLGRVAEAESHFRLLLSRRGESYEGWANLGLVLLKTGRLEEARAALERALAADPGRPEALYSLAQYYRRQGNEPRAVLLYRQALTKAADSRLARRIRQELGGATPAP
jgi:tetratricopeptide (TPR) repeat protein